MVYLLNCREDEAGEADRRGSCTAVSKFQAGGWNCGCREENRSEGAKNGSKETSQEALGWSRGQRRVVWTRMAIKGGGLK